MSLFLLPLPLPHGSVQGAYNNIAGQRLLAPATTHSEIASWGDLGTWKALVGSFWDFNLRFFIDFMLTRKCHGLPCSVPVAGFALLGALRWISMTSLMQPTKTTEV